MEKLGSSRPSASGFDGRYRGGDAVKQQTTKTLYDMHSWAGLWIGLALYIVSFTGVVSLFQAELWRWDGLLPTRAVEETVDYSVNGPVQDVLARYPGIGLIYVDMPHYYYPAIKVVVLPGGVWTNHNYAPVSGKFISQSGEGLARFLRTIHTNLWLPAPYGRYVVGLTGVIFIFSIITGLFIHGHLIRDFFTFRTGRSYRLLLTDSHKGLGLWGLFFHFLIAYTGAFLGLKKLLVLIMLLTAFEGDGKKMQESFSGKVLPRAHIDAPMMNMDILAARAKAYWPGGVLDNIFVKLPGDQNATVMFTVRTPQTDGALTARRQVTFSGVTGALIRSQDPLNSGPGYRVEAMITPLHYGNFSGVGLKFLYAILGIGGSLSIVTGIMLWVERRKGRGAGTGQNHRFLCSLSVGICTGLPLATVMSFYAARLTDHLAPDDRVFWIGVGYFGSCIAALLYSGLRKKHRTATRDLLLATSVACLLVPLMNYVSSGHHIISYVRAGNIPAATVDIMMFCFGLILLYVGKKIHGGIERRI